jgi:uncharacterized protein DUF6627
MMIHVRKLIASLLIVSLAGLGLPLPAHAAMLGADAALAGGAHERLAALADRADVRAQLEAHGVRPADVKARIAALSDTEAAQLAGQIDSLPAGGDPWGGIIGAIVFVFLVLLITDILGLTKIFPFTRSVR